MLTDFEREVDLLTRRVLAEHRDALHQLGLRVDNRGVQVRHPASQLRTSEVEIVLYRGNAIVDILEFFVERHGRPSAAHEEIEQWLRTQLTNLRVEHLP